MWIRKYRIVTNHSFKWTQWSKMMRIANKIRFSHLNSRLKISWVIIKMTIRLKSNLLKISKKMDSYCTQQPLLSLLTQSKSIKANKNIKIILKRIFKQKKIFISKALLKMDSTKEIEDFFQQIIIWMKFKFLLKKICTPKKVKDTIKFKKVMI